MGFDAGIVHVPVARSQTGPGSPSSSQTTGLVGSFAGTGRAMPSFAADHSGTKYMGGELWDAARHRSSGMSMGSSLRLGNNAVYDLEIQHILSRQF